METLLKERVINLEQMMAELIEAFNERDKAWERRMKEWDWKREKERKERERAMAEERKERERAMAEERKERERVLAEERKERERAMAEERKEWERVLAEERKERKEWERKMEEERKKTRAEWERNRKKDRKEWNERWGDLARKMGTIAEDIIAPGTDYAIMKKFNTSVVDILVRRKKRIGDLREEFDIICETEDGKVFMIEVRSTPKVEYVDEIKKKLERFKKLFPEYKGKEIIPVFAGLYFDESIIKYATKQGVYVMGMKGEFIEFLN